MTLAAPRPAPARPRAWSYPPIIESRLSNGLRLVACHVPDRHIAHVSLMLHAGSMTEPLELAGVGSLAARAFAEEEMTDDAVEFTDALAMLGATFGAGCGQYDFLVTVTVPQTRLGQALDILASAVVAPPFPASEVERLKEQRLTGFRNARFRPSATARRAFRTALHAEGSRLALGDEGTEETIPRITREHLAEFVSDRADRAERTVLAAGDFSDIDVHNLIDASLSTLTPPSRSSDPPVEADEMAGDPGPRVIVIDHPGAVQTHLLLGHLGPRFDLPDRAALQVASSVVLSGFGSRLNQRIREELGYTYGIGGGFRLGKRGGVFQISSAVQTDATADTVAETMAVVETAIADGLSQREVAAHREGMFHRGALGLASTAGMMGRMSATARYGLPLDHSDTHRAKILATTPDEASASLRNHLRPAEMIIVASGDASKIAEPLAALERGEVEVVEP